MSIRIYELAKELGLTSKQLIEQLAKLKVSVKGHMSTLEQEVAVRVRQVLAVPKTPVRPEVPARKAGAAKPGTAAKKPPVALTPQAIPTRPAEAPAQPLASPAEALAPSPKPITTAPSPKVKKAAVKKAAVKPAVTEQVAPGAALITPAPEPVVAAPAAEVVSLPKQVRLSFPISVKDLAAKLDVKANELIKHLIGKGIFASLTQLLSQSVATQVAKDFGYELAPQPTLEEQLLQDIAPDPAKLQPRAPVVTLMGHVDHGKTSLLDAIRQSKIAEKEAGGITQHIGAYEVVLDKGRVTFLDTPGHEAFTALRARGANVTDVVVLVVAADDGVMPQTVEAIDHAKAAGVPIVVAVNKIDKPEANEQRVKQQLTEYGLVPEDWGGKTIMVGVSAKTGQGLDGLLEMLLLEAELLELKADPAKPAQGAVIEARLTKDRGPIATLLVQQGSLRLGDYVVVGALAGRVRALTSDRGHRVREVQPSGPVEVLGIPGVPKAGERFMVVTDEKQARRLVGERQERLAERAPVAPRRLTLDDLHQRIAEGTLKEFKLILKVDVQGSLEAIVQSLEKLDTEKEEVRFKILHMGVGDINESDVMLAAASDAIVIGFHVGIDPAVQIKAVNEGVDVRIFQIIYELVGAIKAAIEGLLEPEIEETFLGRAEVRRLFQISKVGIVAGCFVSKGLVRRDALIRIIRGKDRLVETRIASLKRVKDDVREVQEGFECGIALEGSADLQTGDLIEAWEQKKIARKLT